MPHVKDDTSLTQLAPTTHAPDSAKGSSPAQLLRDRTATGTTIIVSQILEIYAGLCGKKVIVDPSVVQKLMRIQTVHPITASEAKRLIEQELKVQARVMLVPAGDGTIAAVPIPAGQE